MTIAEQQRSISHDCPSLVALGAGVNEYPPVVVTAERTAAVNLVIAPRWDGAGRLTGLWRLVHAPTGEELVPTRGLDVGVLRRVAAEVAHLNWSCTTAEAYHRTALLRDAAVEQAVDRVLGGRDS